MFKIFFFFLCAINLISLQLLDNEHCEKWVHNHIFNSTERHYYNITFPMVLFENISELDFLQNYSCQIQALASQLRLYLLHDTILKRDLDLRNLLKIFLFYLNPNQILITEIKGFNQRKNFSIYLNDFYLFLDSVKFEFHLDDKILDEKQCRRENFFLETFLAPYKIDLFHTRYTLRS